VPGVVHGVFYIAHLGNDFAGSEIAGETAAGGQAEPASLGATDLAGYAEGGMPFFRYQYCCDAVAVLQPEKKLSGTVPGCFHALNGQTVNGEMPGHEFTDIFFQIRHGIKSIGLAGINPS